jgi:type IV pilus assembly protein PilE
MFLERKRQMIGPARKTVAAAAGFTLIEMMIVVALIAILAAIVLPSYQDSVRKARRMDARGALTNIAQLMERYNTEKNTYLNATLGSAATDLYPAVSENQHYTLALSGLGASTFTITATPAGGQASDPCGTYTLNQAGTRGAALSVDQCW